MPFVVIPAGTFTMGTPKSAFAKLQKKFDLLPGDEDEHEVELSGFHMGQFLVTRGQFAIDVKDTAYKTEGEEGRGGHGWNEAIKKFDFDKKYSWRNTGFARAPAAGQCP